MARGAAGGVGGVENRATSKEARKQMSLRHAVAILAGAMLGACATVQNTPQQDLVWSAYNQCKAEGRVPANIQLERVEPNGRPRFSAYSSAYGAQELERCLNEKISTISQTAPPKR